jgi:KipI family sensor histidine kinase inhibitor
MADFPRLQVAGEAALIVYLARHSSPAVVEQVQALAAQLQEALGSALVDLIPSYASLLVMFDAQVTNHAAVRKAVRATLDALPAQLTTTGRLLEIPVYYAPESGADLEALGERSGLGWEGVAELHAGMDYHVYAVGFAPGFAYLGTVDERIAAPRLATPRTQVPRGAVAIADRQTAVYPAASPGGWNLIGRSPVTLFDAAAEDPMALRVGDRVRFVAIDRQRFAELGGEL